MTMRYASFYRDVPRSGFEMIIIAVKLIFDTD